MHLVQKSLRGARGARRLFFSAFFDAGEAQSAAVGHVRRLFFVWDSTFIKMQIRLLLSVTSRCHEEREGSKKPDSSNLQQIRCKRKVMQLSVHALLSTCKQRRSGLGRIVALQTDGNDINVVALCEDKNTPRRGQDTEPM